MKKTKTTTRSWFRRSPKTSERSSLQPPDATVSKVVEAPSPQRKPASFQNAEETDPVDKAPSPNPSAPSPSVASIRLADESLSKSTSKAASQPDLDKAAPDSAIPGAIVSSGLMSPRLVRSATDLAAVVNEFKENYEMFASKHCQYHDLLNEDQFIIAFDTPEAGNILNRTAETFGERIRTALQTIENKKSINEYRWTTRLGHFVKTLFPVANLSVSLIGSIGDAACFSPLKGAAAGLGLILQILDAESGRGDDFLFYLGRIEFVSAILADNPKSDCGSMDTQILLQEKSTDLMAAVIRYFNSALIYFRQEFVGNVLNTVLKGPQIYDDGKNRLEMAIREYDQTIMHFTASLLADIKSQQDLNQQRTQDDEFLRWLLPSHWQVEALLHSLRDKRSENTLLWAREMTEFREWRLSEPRQGAKDRILWVRGPLGIGKSTMSAYFIDLLKIMYPNSIVAYFFCRSNQAGLTKAHEIIRTLAYQCIEGNRAAHSILQELKDKDFRISESLGIGYLFEKILLEPLQCTQKDIYIVIDGLDEANTTDCNNSDHSSEPDLHVLLASLARLPSTRLLFVSRPSANISTVVPCTKTKSIGITENAKDIATYVKNAINTSERLRKHFQNENLNPFQYFHEKANGVFLWVELVIKQLEKANSKSVFRKYLDGFSAASGSIERLYESILLRFGEEDQPWVKEVLHWLVVAVEQMMVVELADAVEWCLQDKHIDFRHFLQVDCGSILQLMPAREDEVIVQLVHETLRSFLLNERTCPTSFYVDETEVHAHVTLKCLSRISSDKGEVNTYCISNWIDHLPKAASKTKAPEVLITLHQFFISDALERWIKQGLVFRSENIEDRYMIVISGWLEKWCSQVVGDNVTQRSDMSVLMTKALQWREEVMKARSSLGEYIGKAAARIWLRESFDDPKSSRGYFSVALRHYWNRNSREKHVSNLGDLQELLRSDFRSIAEWSGNTGRSINRFSKGVAFCHLQRWDDCIKCFDNLETREADVELLCSVPYLAHALVAKGDNERAIAVIHRKLHDLTPSDISLLLTAYERKGDLDGAIQLLAANLDKMFRGFEITYGGFLAQTLLQLYVKNGDLDGAVNFFQQRMKRSPSHDSAFDLVSAHLAKGDFDEAIKLSNFMTTPDIDPRWPYQFLKACHMKGEYKGAIEGLTAAVNREPQNTALWVCLVSAYERELEFEKAIQVLEHAVEVLPTSAAIKLLPGNSLTGNDVPDKYIESINLLEGATARHPGECTFWEGLGQASCLRKEFDRAITAFRNALEVGGWKRPFLLRSLFEAYKSKGDDDGAIKAFESNFTLGITKNPNFDVEYWYNILVDTYAAQRNLDGAIDFFQGIVSNSQYGEADWAMAGLLKAYLAKGDYEAVIGRYDDAISRSQIAFSTFLETMILEAYLSKADYTGAIKRFTELAESRPFHSSTWILLGRAYQAKGDYGTAIHVYQSARELLSLDYVYLLEIGDTHSMNNEFQFAIDAYKSFSEMASDPYILCTYVKRLGGWWSFPTQPQIDQSLSEAFVWYSLGRSYQLGGDFDAVNEIYSKAIDGYLAIIDITSRTWQFNKLFWIHGSIDLWSYGNVHCCRQIQLSLEIIWSALGEVYRAKGDLKDALEAFREAHKIRPHNSWLQQTIRELERTITI